jgi:hypothetical protein
MSELRLFSDQSLLLRTPLGRARAWLRLALMQKKMADYLRCLIIQRDLFRLVQLSHVYFHSLLHLYLFFRKELARHKMTYSKRNKMERIKTMRGWNIDQELAQNKNITSFFYPM